MKKLLFSLFSIVIIGVLIRLFLGVYTHDEFLDDTIFIKHKPTWKWHFHSPIGMSDIEISQLSDEDQLEQKYFDEFIHDQGLSR